MPEQAETIERRLREEIDALREELRAHIANENVHMDNKVDIPASEPEAPAETTESANGA